MPSCLLAGLFLIAAVPTVPLPPVRQQVRKAKPVLDTQVQLRDYHANPYQPDQIVERIHALESESAWKELCAELTLLPDEELELFEDEVRKPEHTRHMACAAALLRRIDAHWKQQSLRLAEAHPLPLAGQPPVPPLASVVVAVDMTGDPVLGGASLGDHQIALTFDDGPHPTRTPRLLKILADAGIKATFFQIGKNASTFPDVAKQVVAAGHTVGSHTWSHADLPTLTEPHAETEIESGEAAVALALGLRPGQLPFFRFPYGARTTGEQAFVRRRGNATLFWNMDSDDWKIRDPHRLFLNVLDQIDHANRGIILFHDIHEQTLIVLPHVLAELRARHFRTVVFVAQPPGAVPGTRRE